MPFSSGAAAGEDTQHNEKQMCDGATHHTLEAAVFTEQF
jgi:hypothetical protein